MTRRHIIGLGTAFVSAVMIDHFTEAKAIDVDSLQLPTDVDQRLARLKAQPKFHADGMYLGYMPEEHQPAAEKLVNDLIERLQANLKSQPSKAYLKQEINETYNWFQLSDTEDRDRCLLYVSEILLAVGIAPEDSAIRKWILPLDSATLSTGRFLEQ